MTKEIFEVIGISENSMAFTVEVEIITTRERRKFGYPKYEGWENEINGEEKFITDIRDKITKELNLKEDESHKKIINNIKAKLIGKKFK